MSFNYNHITIVGKIAENCVCKPFGDTKRIILYVAVDRPWRLDDGTKETDYIRVLFWGRLAEIASSMLKKDITVLIEGRLQIKEYEENGKKIQYEIIGENFQKM